jgi:hypothetical protein
VTRDELPELHYITPIANVASILTRSILSHKLTARLEHVSVAKAEVQGLRAKVRVPGGRMLHEYANLYICARNPMMFLRQGEHAALCVLRVATGVLDLPGVVVTDRNAASPHRRFAPAPAGLAIVDRDKTFAEFWTHPGDQIAEWRHKSMKCAEVLVPDSVDPRYIMGAYVSGAAVAAQLGRVAPQLPATVNGHMFFR